MALEPITRQEKIIAGKDLEPITRMEMFLKQYGGGSGGGADWNAAEGEAGYVKNRTHYESEEIVNEPLNITWDGNTEGLVSVGCWSEGNSSGGFYKVSDVVLADEAFKSATFSNNDGYSYSIAAEEWEYMVSEGWITEDYINFGESVIVIKNPALIFTVN